MSSATNLKRAALASVAVYSALVSAQATGLDVCTDVHIFLSRGNNEPYPGRQGKLIDAVCAGLDSCDYEDIAFNNALEVNYCQAIEEGRAAGVRQITDYNNRCPNTKLVVSGYSQGSHVVGDIFGGGGGTFFEGCTTPPQAPLSSDSAAARAVAAIVTFGDVRHTAYQSYNVLGGAQYQGLYPRPSDMLANLNNYASIRRDWCAGDDPVCARGDGSRQYSVENHLNYFDIYTGDAAQFIWPLVGGTKDSDAPTPTPTPTTTPTPTPSPSSTSESTSVPVVDPSSTIKVPASTIEVPASTTEPVSTSETPVSSPSEPSVVTTTSSSSSSASTSSFAVSSSSSSSSTAAATFYPIQTTAAVTSPLPEATYSMSSNPLPSMTSHSPPVSLPSNAAYATSERIPTAFSLASLGSLLLMMW